MLMKERDVRGWSDPSKNRNYTRDGYYLRCRGVLPSIRQPKKTTVVPVQHTETRHPQRELLVGADPVLEHHTMARTIHRLQEPLLAFDIHVIHPSVILEEMSRRLEQRLVVEVRRDHLGTMEN